MFCSRSVPDRNYTRHSQCLSAEPGLLKVLRFASHQPCQTSWESSWMSWRASCSPIWGVPLPQPPSHTGCLSPLQQQSWWEAAETLHSLQHYLKFPIQSHKGKNTHLQSLSPLVIMNNCESVTKIMFQRNILAFHIPDIHHRTAQAGMGNSGGMCAFSGGRRAVPSTGLCSAPRAQESTIMLSLVFRSC